MQMSAPGTHGWLDQAIRILVDLFHHLSVASDDFIATMLDLDE